MKRNNTKIRAFCATALTIIGIASASAGDNILENAEFADQGKFWGIRYSKIEESIQEENGKKAVKMEMHALADNRGNNVFIQNVRNPKGGVYVYSAEVAPSRKFAILQLLLIYRNDKGKDVYQFVRMKPAEYPEPGKWTRLIGEVNLPEGRKSVAFVVEIRDPKPEGFVLIRNPMLNLKEE